MVCVDHFNQVGGWVVKVIVQTEKKSARARLIQRFVTLAKECLDIGNFQTAMQILSGLENSAITRLKKTWAEIGKNSTLIEIKKVFNFQHNSKAYRTALNEKKGTPCVPFLGKNHFI